MGDIKSLKEIDPPGDHPLKQYMARVEQLVKESIDQNCFIIAIVPKDEVVRPGYWEKRYIVAYYSGVNRNNFVTHTACIDSEGKAMLVDGWYRRDRKQALTDMLGRSGLNWLVA